MDSEPPRTVSFPSHPPLCRFSLWLHPAAAHFPVVSWARFLEMFLGKMSPGGPQGPTGVAGERRRERGRGGGETDGAGFEPGKMFATKKGASSSAHNPSHLMPSEVMDKCIGSKLWVSWLAERERPRDQEAQRLAEPMTQVEPGGQEREQRVCARFSNFWTLTRPLPPPHSFATTTKKLGKPGDPEKRERARGYPQGLRFVR